MSPYVDGLAHLAWIQLWQVAVVALLVGAVARLCCRNRPRLAYALWMLVVVKSIVPPVWSSPVGLFSWALVGTAAARPDAATQTNGEWGSSPVIAPVRGNTVPVTRIAEGEAAPKRGIDWHDVSLAAFSIWSAGLVLGIGYVLGKQLICANLIRRSRVAADGRITSKLVDLSRRLRVKRRVRLIVTSKPIGPLAFGLFRPAILLPELLLDGIPAEQIDLVLAHELIHVRRGDVLANKLQLVAHLIWWFNPLVWWANQQADRERERCCDEEVVAGVGCKPVLYARTLLNVLEQKGRLRALVALPGVRALEVTSQRLESIMKYSQTDYRRASSTLAARLCGRNGIARSRNGHYFPKPVTGQRRGRGLATGRRRERGARSWEGARLASSTRREHTTTVRRHMENCALRILWPCGLSNRGRRTDDHRRQMAPAEPAYSRIPAPSRREQKSDVGRFVGRSIGRSNLKGDLLVGRRSADDLLRLRSRVAEANRIQDYASRQGLPIRARSSEEG